MSNFAAAGTKTVTTGFGAGQSLISASSYRPVYFPLTHSFFLYLQICLFAYATNIVNPHGGRLQGPVEINLSFVATANQISWRERIMCGSFVLI